METTKRNKLHTSTMISIRDESLNGFLPKILLEIDVTGYNGVSIIGSLKVLDGSFIKSILSFALNSGKVLFITSVGNNGISFDYIKLIEKTQPELTNNILLLYENYKINERNN